MGTPSLSHSLDLSLILQRGIQFIYIYIYIYICTVHTSSDEYYFKLTGSLETGREGGSRTDRALGQGHDHHYYHYYYYY